MVDVAVMGPGDYQELASFMASFPDVKPRSVDNWRNRLSAWWDLNPAFQESFPRGWLLRDNAKITGFFGSIPLKLQLGGKETIAIAATSWRVLPEYRGKSIGLKLRQLGAHKEQLHFSTTPKEELVPLLNRLGYEQIRRGQGTQYQSQLILDFEKFLRARYRNVPLSSPIAMIGAPLLTAFHSFRTRRLKKSLLGDVRDLARADESFNDLWQRSRTRYANTNVRTAEMVNWYCFAMQPADKKLLAYYDQRRLVGYMVLLVKEDPERRFLECVDVWIDPAADEVRVLRGLVAEAADFACRAAFERILFPHFDSGLAILYGQLGLLRGPAWKKREYIKGPRHVMKAITLDNSYFVRAQGDYGL